MTTTTTTRANRWVSRFDDCSKSSASCNNNNNHQNEEGTRRRKFLKTTPRGTQYYKWIDCDELEGTCKDADEFFSRFNQNRRRSSAIVSRSDVKRSQERLIAEALHAHNRCRLKHGVEPLVHNPDLSKIAQSFADSLAAPNKATLYHSSNEYKNSPLGENLAWMFNPRVDHYSGEEVTKQWYNEEKMHDYNGGYQPQTGHFTQVQTTIYS